MVFVGGATTGLLITDPGAPEVRATKDVDVIVTIASRSEYYELGARLRALGFAEDQSEDAPICRWRFGDDLFMDVMPTEADIVGFSNRWYPDAVTNSTMAELEPDLQIRVVTAPYYCATKLEAFHGRGNSDVLASHDLEDFVAVVDGRPELIDEIRVAESNVRAFLASEAALLLENRAFVDAISGFVPNDEERAPIIAARLMAIAKV